MTILITTSSFGVKDAGVFSILKKHGLSYVLNPYKRKLTEDEIFSLIEEHQPIGLIAGIEPLTPKVLARAEKLKTISRCGIGMDGVDIGFAESQGISVTNTPDAPTIAVAELTLGMILTLLRRLHISDASIRRGEWERPMGNLLYGKTIGILGCGRIGSALANLLKPFSCRILGCDQVCNDHECLALCDVELLQRESDILTIHIPYDKNNHHLVNAEFINKMKNGAILINAARGGLVDEQALLQALQTGTLGGAALDCFEIEPYTGPFRDLDNVLLTGHLGSYAEESRIMMENQAVDNLIKELQKAHCIS